MNDSQKQQATPLPEQLQYPWPPNLTTYEVRLWAGLTAQQWMLIVMGGMLPTAVQRSILGAVIGLVVAGIVFLSFKKVGRWGGISLPHYVWLRLLGLFEREAEVMELPLILGGSESTVEIESWEGETLIVVEE